MHIEHRAVTHGRRCFPSAVQSPMHTRALVLPTIALAALLASCKSTNTAGYLIDGDLAYSATQWPKAADNYEKYLTTREGDHRVRERLGNAYLNMGEYPKAVHQLRLVHTQVPGNVKVTNALAEALFKAGKNDELYRLLRSEAVESQTEADWMRLGDYAIKLGDKDTAQTAYRSAAKVCAGRSIDPYIALFDYHRSLGQREEATRNLRYAAWVDPNSSKVAERIKLAGVIDGPTFAQMPPEAGNWADKYAGQAGSVGAEPAEAPANPGLPQGVKPSGKGAP